MVVVASCRYGELSTCQVMIDGTDSKCPTSIVKMKIKGEVCWFVCLVFSGLYKAIKFFPHNAGIKPDVRMIRGCHIPRPCVSCRIARLCLCVCVCFLFPIETVVVSRRSASGPPPTTITTLTDACRSTRFCHPLPLPLPFPLP